MGVSKIIYRTGLRIFDYIEKKVNIARKYEILDHKDYTISIGDEFAFNFLRSKFEIHPTATVDFAKGVGFRDFCNILVYSGAKLKLGELVFFNRYCSINCLGNITIGDYTIFGEGVKLYDHNHKFADVNTIIQQVDCKVGNITIGRNCWIGANVTILNNVTIGDNVVIGAGNLIYKDIPSNVVVKNKTEQIIQSRL